MLTKGTDASSIITHERYGVVVSFWIEGWSTQHIGPLPQQKRSYLPAYPSQTRATTPTEKKKNETKKEIEEKTTVLRESFFFVMWEGGWRGVGR